MLSAARRRRYREGIALSHGRLFRFGFLLSIGLAWGSEQPIAYSHRQHIALGLHCLDCHSSADTGSAATIPSVRKCMLCHARIATAKPEIKKLDETLKDLKSEYKEKAAPYKEVVDELDRIDESARNALSVFVTEKERQAAEVKIAAPTAGEGPKFMPAVPASAPVSYKGHDLGFTTKKVVQVVDINAVPDQYIQFKPNQERIAAWLGSKLGTVLGIDFGVEVLSDGRIKVTFQAGRLPKELMDRADVKERLILDANGCDGVKIIEEKRAVVR